jgi:hypothetical protein
MEKCECDLQTALKKENLELDERKKIATGIEAGFGYLAKIGISHCDRKLTNLLSDFCWSEMSSKFATSVLLKKNRGEEATGSLDTREEGQNINNKRPFVSFGVKIILNLF